MSTAAVVEDIRAPRGTLVHIEGLPFRLTDDTVIQGLLSNWELAQSLAANAPAVSLGTGTGGAK